VVAGLPALTRDVRVREAISALIHGASDRGCVAFSWPRARTVPA
jgi:hypothetical protein